MKLKLMLLALLLVGCSPSPTVVQTSTGVQISEAQMLVFSGALIALFTVGCIYIFEKTGLDLRQFAIPIAMTISTALVAAAQNWINVQPLEWDPWIALTLRVLEALLAGFGVLRIVSREPRTLMPPQ